MKIKRIIFFILVFAISLILLPTNVKAEVLQEIVIDDSSIVPVVNEEPKFITLDGTEKYTIISEAWSIDGTGETIILKELNWSTNELEVKKNNNNGIKFERGIKYRYDVAILLKDGYTVDTSNYVPVNTSTIDWDFNAIPGIHVDSNNPMGVVASFYAFYTVPLFNITLEDTPGITIAPSGTIGVQLNREYIVDYTLEDNYKLKSIKQTVTKTDNTTEVTELMYENYHYSWLKQIRLMYSEDATIKDINIQFIAEKITTYDLIVEEAEHVTIKPSGTMSVKGDEIKEITITPDKGYSVASISKITTYNDNSSDMQEVIYSYNEDILDLSIDNDNTIKNVKIVVKTAKDPINAEELKAALGGDEYVKVEGNTVKLIKDVELSASIHCIAGEYVLDLNGHKIGITKYFTGMVPLEVVGTAKLTIKDSSNGKGTIVGESCISVSENASLIIDGGRYEAYMYAIACDGKANITINDGEFTTTEYGLFVYYAEEYGIKPTVTLKGGTFKGMYAITLLNKVSDKKDIVTLPSLLADGCVFESNEEVKIVTEEDEYEKGLYISYFDNSEVKVKAPIDIENNDDTTENKNDKDNNGTTGNGANKDESTGNTSTGTASSTASGSGNANANKPTSNNPQTGDNIWLFVGLLGISIVGIFATIKFNKTVKK